MVTQYFTGGFPVDFIVSKGRDVTNSYGFTRGAGSDGVIFFLRNGFFTPLIGLTSAPVSPGAWHHVTGVVDNGVTVSLYVDGVLADVGAMSEPYVATNVHPLVFGRHY